MSKLLTMLNTILAIAYRDLIKLFRDRTRILASLVFPVVFIGALGGSLQSNWGDETGYNLLVFVFTGVFGQTMFQSTASGIISLVEDRTNDFSQEMFVAPVSRTVILLGKILGETLVSFAQGIAILIFGLIIGVPLSALQILMLIGAALIMSFLGGAFGILVLGNVSNQRTANQIFPFLLFPQFFLAGVFSPIKDLPWYLFILSRISPMTYAVDLGRAVYYWGKPEYSKVVLFNPFVTLTIITLIFVVFLSVGTYLFTKNEADR